MTNALRLSRHMIETLLKAFICITNILPLSLILGPRDKVTSGLPLSLSSARACVQPQGNGEKGEIKRKEAKKETEEEGRSPERPLRGAQITPPSF